MGSLRKLLGRFSKARREERTFCDPVIGLWRTTVRVDKPVSWCLWEAKMVVDGEPKDTYLSLSGDPSRPFPSLLEEVHRLLAEIGQLRAIVEAELTQRAPRHCLREFYLSEISDWDMHDDILQVEFAPLDEQHRVLSQELNIWPEDRPDIGHRVVLRTVDVRLDQGQLVERGLA